MQDSLNMSALWAALSLLCFSAVVAVSLLTAALWAVSRNLVKTHVAWAKSRDTYILATNDIARMVRFIEDSPNGKKAPTQAEIENLKRAYDDRMEHARAVREAEEITESPETQPGVSFGVDPSKF